MACAIATAIVMGGIIVCLMLGHAQEGRDTEWLDDVKEELLSAIHECEAKDWESVEVHLDEVREMLEEHGVTQK